MSRALKTVIAIWLVLMIGTAVMIAAIAYSQYNSRQRFLDRDLTPPPVQFRPERRT